MLVFSCEFCKNFKNNFYLQHAWTTGNLVFGNLRFTLWKCAVLSSISTLIHFKLISKFFIQPQARFYYTVKNLWWSVSAKIANGCNRSIFVKLLHHRCLTAFSMRLCSLLFYNFPLSLFVYLTEHLNIMLFFWKCAVA